MPGACDNFLANLPTGWGKIRLGNIGIIHSGGTPSRSVQSYWNGDIPWVTPGELTDLDDNYLRVTAERITQRGLGKSSATLIPRDALLVTTRATIGSVALAAMPLAANQGFRAVVFSGFADPHFYYHLFSRIRHELVRRSTGTTFLEISGREFSAIEVPLPSLQEQRQVSRTLDTLDEIIGKTRQTIAKLCQIKQGLLHDLLTRGVDENGELRNPREHPEKFKKSLLGSIPNAWKIVPLGDVVASATDGPFGSNLKTEHYVASPGVRVVRLQNIGLGEFVDADRVYISEPHAKKLRKYEVCPGDLLVASLGDENHLIARACIFPPMLAPAIVKADCFRLRANSELAENGFLSMALNCPATRMDLNRLAQGVTRDRVNLVNLRRFRLGLPSLAEQGELLRLSAAMDDRLESERKELMKLKLLKQGLMNDLLTGRVRVPLLEG